MIYVSNISIILTRITIECDGIVDVDLPVSGRALLIRVEKNPRMLVATRESPSRLRPPPGACCPRISTVVPVSRCTAFLWGPSTPVSPVSALLRHSPRCHSLAWASDAGLRGRVPRRHAFYPVTPDWRDPFERHRLGGESRRHPRFALIYAADILQSVRIWKLAPKPTR